MPNIQNIPILFNSDNVFLNNALSPVDLSYINGTDDCNKVLTTKYIIVTGVTYVLYDSPVPGSTLVTLITNPLLNLTWISSASPASIAELFVENCATVLGSSCDNPIFVNVCENSGTPAAPVINHDVEFVQNETTGFLDKVTNTWIDGILQPQVVVPTTYTVATKPKDVEVSTICNTSTGFYEVIERIYNVDGTLASQTITPTTIGCIAAPAQLYNNNETQVNSGINPIVLSGNTYHSVSIVILKGSATIDNNGVVFVAPQGYSKTWEADALLSNTITITATSAIDTIIVDTIN